MTARARIDLLAYAAFIALIMCAPLALDEFWLNRIAKFLEHGG